MSDKMTCPGCDSYTSGVLADFTNEEECRYCGLPHEAAAAILSVRRTAADADLKARYEDAITRATRAEADSVRFAALLFELRELIERFSVDRSGDPTP